MTKLTTNTRITAITMSVMMAFSGMVVSPNAIAASSPTIAKKATVTVGAKKSLAIKTNGFTVKSVKVKSSSKKVTVKCSKKNITVTGVKVGTATITTTLKASKGKKKAKTFKYTTTVTVKKSKIKPTPTPDVTAEVSTQEELVKALGNNNLTKLTIGQKATSLEIPEGTYDKVDLVVNAPDATITNNATFKSIEIKAVAADTFIEKGGRNNIIVSAKNPVHIIVDTLKELLSLVFGKGSDQASNDGKNKVEIKNGNVEKVEFSGKSNVEMKVQNDAIVGNVTVKEGSNVKLEATNQAQINNVNISGDGTKADITSDGNSKVDTVKVGEGAPEAIISGDSKNQIILDIKDATKDAKATVNTGAVKVSSDSNDAVKGVVNNQSGKTIETEIVKPDGTTESGSKPADGNSGVKPSEPSGGGSYSPSSFTVTLDLNDDENARAATISESDLTAAGFTASGYRKWVKTYNAGATFGNIPRPTLEGKQFITWGYSDADQGVLANETVKRSCILQSVFADEIRVQYCKAGESPDVTTLPDPSVINNATEATSTHVATGDSDTEGRYFIGWQLGNDPETLFTTSNTIGDVVKHALRHNQIYDWSNDYTICFITLYPSFASEEGLIEEELNKITFSSIKGSNSSAGSVTSALVLTPSITIGTETKQVTWEIENSDCAQYFNTSTGAVTRDVYDQEISIRPTCGGVHGDWIEFTIPKDTNLRYIKLALEPGETITDGTNTAGFVKVSDGGTDRSTIWRITVDSSLYQTLGGVFAAYPFPTVTKEGKTFSKWMYHHRDNQDDTDSFLDLATSDIDSEESDSFPEWTT